NVCDASPPVPTMSTRLSRSGTWTRVANSRITCAAAAISPIVSFLTRRPTVSAAIITGVSSPLMILRMIDSISSAKISRCSIVRCSASWGVMAILGLLDGSVPRRAVQEILEQRVPVLGEDRFGMELHAFDGELAVAHTHHFAVIGSRRHLEALG